MPTQQPTIAELDSALHTMLDENDALRAELAQLRAENKQLVDWIMGNCGVRGRGDRLPIDSLYRQ